VKIPFITFTTATVALLCVCLCQNVLLAGSVNIANLRCEYMTNPQGIDQMNPRLSWMLESDQRGQKQDAYRILVAGSAENLAKDIGDLWEKRSKGKCLFIMPTDRKHDVIVAKMK